MKSKTAMMALAAACCSIVCGPKTIDKQPVPHESYSHAIRLMAEGDRLLQDEKVHLAMLKYLEASQENPYDEKAFNKLAGVYSRLQMYYQARKAVNRAIGLNKDYAFAYNTQGILNLTDKDLKGAASSFRKAIELKPDVASFYVNLGFAEGQRGNPERALRAYRRASELEPDIFERGQSRKLDITGFANPLRYYELGLVFAELDKFELCLWHLEEAISLGFDDYKRLRSEPALQRFRDLAEYQEFLDMYGVDQ
jgi:tetratricopeptide (TPR) repeat protein